MNGLYKNQIPLYCQPEKLALNPDNFLQLLDSHISKWDIQGEDSPIELIFLTALKEAFPCHQKSDGP